MGNVQATDPVLLLMAMFSRHETALDWARSRAEADFGPVALASERFPFIETNYYEAEMGTDILKQFLVFENFVDPARLAEIKHTTNVWEEEYKSSGGHEEQRPLNLDPGYLTEAKLVLATTKDRDHRIYIGQGMFAEITLHFRGGQWQSHPWTYPNYKRDDYHVFFNRCRELVRARRRSGKT